MGAWRQDFEVSGHGTRRYCLYTFHEDLTLDYLDHREYDYVKVPQAEDSGDDYPRFINSGNFSLLNVV